VSRGDGFQTADLDVGLFNDPKIRAVVRTTLDEGLTVRAVLAFVAVVLSSWERGERVSLEDAAPLWLTSLDGLQGPLEAVGLLDADGRLPDHSWQRWFGPAQARRAKRKAAGSLGGQASAANRGEAMPGQPSSNALAPLHPTVNLSVKPSVHPSVARAPMGASGAAVAPAKNGHADPLCFRDPTGELYRRHQTDHYVLAGGRSACRACDREAVKVAAAPALVPIA